MWFSVICTLIDNVTGHRSGKNFSKPFCQVNEGLQKFNSCFDLFIVMTSHE